MEEEFNKQKHNKSKTFDLFAVKIVMWMKLKVTKVEGYYCFPIRKIQMK